MAKSQQQIIISALVILVVLVGGYFLIKSHNTKPKTTPNTDAKTEKVTPKLIDESLVSEKSYNTPDQYAIFKVKYPEFKNASAVIDAIAEHKKDSANNWQARYDNQLPGEKISEFPAEADKLELDIAWTPVQVNNNFISATLNFGGYTGGAHGYSNTVSFNYDVKNKHDVTLKDLFPNDSNYLKTLSDFSRTNLQAQFKKSLEIKTAEDTQNFKDNVLPMLLDGTTPTADNFKTFTFTPTTITIYFAEYQVGPYVMGEPTVNFPRK